MLPAFVNVDIEPTNRCNAKCYFCPRDQTPHQGLMSPETFEQALARTIEFRPVVAERLEMETRVALCGLGEPLLNRHTPSFVARVREEGFACSMASNGALLDEERGKALLDAGLQEININVGDEGEEYEDVYKLPFERTYENVVRFAEMAADRCTVRIVLVDHRGDAEHHAAMKQFWRERGLEEFITFPIMNRGGALFVDHMQYEQLPEHQVAVSRAQERGAVPACYAPFYFLFSGYDGLYYLCCSDWKKEVPLGSVFDTTFLEITRRKLEHVLSREPICKQCNLDPINQLTGEFLAAASGDTAHGGNRAAFTSGVDPDALLNVLVADTTKLLDRLELLEPGVTEPRASDPTPPRRLIPLTAE